MPFLSLSLKYLNLFTLSSISFIASSAAAPIPTIPGTFSVPALLPPSCIPPSISGFNLIPFLTYNPPTPFGA